MSKVVRYVKPNGVELDITNSKESLAYAESLGWRPVEEEVEEETDKPKRRRRTKEEMEAAKAEDAINKTNCESDSN